MHRRDTRDPRDNSFGLGYYAPPPRILGLGRFADNLRPNRLVDMKVWPREGIWMLTARSDERLSILEGDLDSLLKQGLVRIMVNRPGTISFYFKDKPIAGPTIPPARDRRRLRRRRA